MTLLQSGITKSLAADAYTIDQSLRFDDGDSAYLHATSGTATSNTIGTFSAWVKRGAIGSAQFGIFGHYDDANDRSFISIDADTIFIYGRIGGTGKMFLVTTQLLRDPGAWYHIVFALDVTQGVAASRAKLYINGNQVTAFSTETYPVQDVAQPLLGGQSSTNMVVGAMQTTTGYFDGYLAEFYYIDGQQLTPASFGETDSTTNQWKPIDASGLTFGTNGFYQKYASTGGHTSFTTVESTTWTAPAGVTSVEVLVVAGGGGGGVGNGFGGGGAGGLVEHSGYTVVPGTSYGITVGDGGAGGTASGGSSGSNSVFDSAGVGAGPITALGGGAGSYIEGGSGASGWAGVDGGSGGGAGPGGGAGSGTQGDSGGGTGYGNDGGTAYTSGANDQGGGGGSAGAAGTNAHSGGAGAGGAGRANTITGASVTYAGGGGGGSRTSAPASGGSGGGGAGAANGTVNGTAGTDGLGGGGGGGGRTATHGASSDGGDGGSGIVIVKAVAGQGFGLDSSGEGNNFTPTNLVATDQMKDSPTNNWCTLSSITKTQNADSTLTEGNLQATTVSANWNGRMGTVGISSGKWYWEIYQKTIPTNNLAMYGIVGDTDDQAWAGNSDPQGGSASIVIYGFDGNKLVDGSDTGGYGVSYTAGDIIGVALNMTDSELTIYKNNVAMNSGTAISFSGGVTTASSISPLFVGYGAAGVMVANFGQDSSFAGNKTAQGNADGNSVGDFYYEPPTDYLALCTSNLSAPSIKLPGDNFNTVLYTGDGATTLAVTGVGFQPDFTWIKNRSAADKHVLVDAVRVANNYLSSDSTAAEVDDSTFVASLDSDGFTVGDDVVVNTNTENYVSWNWLGANSTVTNTAGNNIDSTVSANPTAGFSICKYNGNEVAGDSFGHGLSEAPELVIIKRLDTAAGWPVFNSISGNTKFLELNTIADPADADAPWNHWNDTSPSATVVTLGDSGDVNDDDDDYIAYCWHGVEGYSKIGTYTGNDSTDGTFVYTGFAPAFVIMKRLEADANWRMSNNKSPYDYNQHIAGLLTNDSQAEETSTSYAMDYLSNGFKFRTTIASMNTANSFLYIAFAESPFKYGNAR